MLYKQVILDEGAPYSCEFVNFLEEKDLAVKACKSYAKRVKKGRYYEKN